MIPLKHFIFSVLRVLVRPFVWVHLAFEDERIMTTIKLRKEFRSKDTK